jgi:hypothetical protein
MNTELTRRGLIQGGAGLAAASLLVRSSNVLAAGAAKSRVVLVRDLKAIDGDGNARPGVVQEMIDAAVCELIGETDPVDAWGQIVRRRDVVGIKSNRWQSLPTPPAIEDAIRRRVIDVGVNPGDIAVDDRGVLKNGVFLRSTALVNTRPMRTHHWAGLGTCVKNYVMFAPEPSAYHANACESLGAVWRLPICKDKTRLNVLVMLTPQFHGVGPHNFSREHVWPYAGLVVSRDPVAADAIGASIIVAKRRDFFGEHRPISPTTRHIDVADTRFSLGNARLRCIELLRVGESKDSLI